MTMTYMIEQADKVAIQLEKFSLDEPEFRTACARLDTSVDLADLKRD